MLKIMLKSLFICIFCILFSSVSAETNSWKNNGFIGHQLNTFTAEELSLNSLSNDYIYIKLDVIYIKNAGWKLKEVKNYITDAFKVLAQCKVGIKTVRFHGVDSLKEKINFSRYPEEDGDDNVVNFTESIPIKTNTFRAIFLNHFYDVNTSGQSYGLWKYSRIGSSYLETKLLGSVWFSKNIKTSQYKERIKEFHYDTVAHEFMHVFTGLGGHIDPYKYPKNILSTFLSKTRSNHILPEHCELVRKNFQANLAQFKLKPKFKLKPQAYKTSQVSLKGNVPFAEFPDIQKHSKKIWNFVQKRLGLTNIKPPQVHFYPFVKAQQSAEFNSWQKRWLLKNYSLWQEWVLLYNKKNQKKINLTPRWVKENIDIFFPFPKGFRAFFYEGTNNIQIASGHKASVFNRRQKDILGTIFYTLGHEILHYGLEKKNVPIKIHHCLFVREFANHLATKKSLIDELADFLISNEISADTVRIFTSIPEKRFQPCSKLNKAEISEVEKVILELSRINP